MATNKNITMKQFNGTDYDTLYPKTVASQIPDVYSTTETITAETLGQLGLGADKLPNDAFQQIKTLINNAQTSADNKAKIQIGSYVGTGTYGVNNPCSLTFDFVPKYLWVSSSGTAGIWNYASSNNIGLHYMPGITACSAYLTGQYNNVKISVSGKTISWYLEYDINDRKPFCQLNESGTTYFYVAFG